MLVHLDHSCLAIINKLARKWGLSTDVHKNVKILVGDNDGERFLSVYHIKNKKEKETYMLFRKRLM